MGGGTGVCAAGGRIECDRGCEIVLKRVTGGGMACDRSVSGGEDGSEMGMEFDGELNAVCMYVCVYVCVCMCVCVVETKRILCFCNFTFYTVLINIGVIF